MGLPLRSKKNVAFNKNRVLSKTEFESCKKLQNIINTDEEYIQHICQNATATQKKILKIFEDPLKFVLYEVGMYKHTRPCSLE